MNDHAGNERHKPVQIRFDYEEKAVYVDEAVTRVIDLDDPKYFSYLWEGFTTGEVELQLSAGGYLSNRPAQFFITKIASTDIELEDVVDTIKPNIAVDYGCYDKDNIPNGLVNEPYPIFDVKVTDNSFKFKDSISVYKNYYSTSRLNIDTQEGFFVPKEPGNYYIEYKAKDYSGNETIEVLKILVVANWDEIALEVEEQFFDVTYNTGHLVTIPSYSTSGGFGQVKTQVLVRYQGTNVCELDDTLSFRPEKDGAYEIVFVSKDYIGKTTTETYILNVAASQNPVFVVEGSYPKYLMAGYKYKFDDLYAYDYAQGSKKEVLANIVVKSGANEKIVNGTYTPDATQPFVEICYEARTTTGVSRTQFVKIPVVNVKNADNWYDYTQYFVGEDVSSFLSEKSILLSSTKKIDFINALLADGFNLELAFDKKPFKADYFRIGLCDSDDLSQLLFVDLRISKESKLQMRINDGQWLELLTYKGNSIRMQYDNITQISTITIDNQTMSYTINSTSDGKEFNGFDSGKIYLTFEFVNASENNFFELYKINSQVFSSKKNNIKPSIAFTTNVSYFGDYNEVYTINRAVALDVLDPMVTFTMTVLEPNGQIVKDVNGLELKDVDPTKDYQIKLDSYGVYVVSYYAEDSMKRVEKNIGFSITVFERNVPVITLEGKEIVEGNVGESIYIPKAIATDIEDGELKVNIYITTPAGRVYSVTGDGFKADVAGKYTVCYSVYDSSYNLAMYTYEIIVK